MSSNGTLNRSSATNASYHTMTADVSPEPYGVEGNIFNICLAFGVVSMGPFLFGFWRGISSEVINACQLLWDESCGCTVGTLLSLGFNQCYDLTDIQQGFLTCSPFFGAVVSSIVCSNTGDYFSRISEVKVCGILSLVGGVCISLSPNLLGVVIGLLAYGASFAIGLHAGPLYLTEITTDKLRARFVAGNKLSVFTGGLVGYFVGWVCGYVSGYGWRLMMVVVILISGIIVLSTVWIPRSPCWLVLQALTQPMEAEVYMAEAKSSLEFFRSGPTSSVNAELDVIQKSVLKWYRPDSDESTLSKYYRHAKCVITAWGLGMLMQLSGTPMIGVESTNIFEVAGWSFSTARLLSLCNGIIKLGTAAIAVFTVDRFGARDLLLGGCAVLFVSYALMIFAFTEVSCSEKGTSVWNCDVEYIVATDVASYVVVVGVLLNSAGFNFGFGALIWLVAVQLLPSEIRARCLSSMQTLFFSCYVLVVLLVDVLFARLTMWGVWVMFGCEVFGATIFIWFLIPGKKNHDK